MGTICYLRDILHPLHKHKNMSMLQLYSCYINNKFIWEGKYNDLKNKIKFLRELPKHPTIKFNFNISKDAISFLDTKVYIDKNKHL